MRSPHASPGARLLLGLCLALAAACERAPFATDADVPPVALAFQASVASAPEVDLIVVEVSGPGIGVPILGNFPVADGRAEGTLRVPAGNGRVFTARGFDAQGAVTHEGSVTRDVRPNGPPLEIPLPPRGVGVPIVVTLGGFVVAVEPADPALTPPFAVGAGQSLLFRAVVRDAAGNPVTADPAALVWASSNPAVARVAKDGEGRGEVTGFYQGTAEIAVSYQGMAARVTVTVDGIVAGTVSAGSAHTCGLTISGTAYCWGSNSSGALGDGTTTTRLVPTPVSGSHAFRSLSAGRNHTCGVRTDDAAFCWGENELGQLGNGTTTNRLVPTAVSGSHAFRSLSAGRSHTCGVRTDDAAFCWGRNSFGQLGDGTNAIYRPVPTAVSGSHAFRSLSAGWAHTCGVRTDRATFCWGSNTAGQLGDGTTTQRLLPTAVSGGHAFVSISAGGDQTCGVRTDNAAFCWGSNTAGQLGDGTTTERLVPTAVSGWLSLP